LPDTYNRRTLLRASRRRKEDATALYEANRYTGAIYLGGYVIECSLKSLICYNITTNNFKETNLFKQGERGNTLHNLATLLSEIPELHRSITTDRTGTYKAAWNKITSAWQKDELRYGEAQGDEAESKNFLEAVKLLHQKLLEMQVEAS
jgi:hypothetical protein